MRSRSGARIRVSALDFVTRLFKNVPVLDAGARGATTTFVQRGIGDVLVVWENEAILSIKEVGEGPARDRDALREHSGGAAGGLGGQSCGEARDKSGGARRTWNIFTLRTARRSPPSTITVPGLKASPASTPNVFPKVSLFTIDEMFGGWQKAQKAHFGDGGTFDQIQARTAESRPCRASEWPSTKIQRLARVRPDHGLYAALS